MPTFVASATLVAKLSALQPSIFRCDPPTIPPPSLACILLKVPAISLRTGPQSDFALAPTAKLDNLLKPPPGAPPLTVMGQAALKIILSPAQLLGVDAAPRAELSAAIGEQLDADALAAWLREAEGVGAAVTAAAAVSGTIVA